MRKINKIYIIISVLILFSACGGPRGLSAKTGRDVNCESELGNFSKYMNLDKLSTTTDNTCRGQEVKVNNKKVGITCGNIFTITSELTDLFTNYRMVNAIDTLEDTFEYGSYSVNVKYYLYENIQVIDSDTEKPKEVDVSGITAQYNIKVEDKYISGMEHGFDLDKKYDNFTKISKTCLEKLNLLIIKTLDTYTKLKTS
ncbi:hypothetical protein [Thomasclavelia sp.]